MMTTKRGNGVEENNITVGLDEDSDKSVDEEDGANSTQSSEYDESDAKTMYICKFIKL